MINFKVKKDEFDSLTEAGQWLWAINNKGLITITIDNDNTVFTFNEENKNEDCTLVFFKSDIGNRLGVEVLLKILGFNIERK